MACLWAKPSNNHERPKCSVSGDDCVFLIPNSKSCAEMFGEGPDADIAVSKDDNEKGLNDEPDK